MLKINSTKNRNSSGISKALEEKSIVLLQNFFSSKNFLIYFSAAIFLLSVYLRSRIDTGQDTNIYISLGKRIYEGGRYYYTFLESNMPILFYIYALEYRLSLFLNINPIITSEIIVNLLGVLSIFWSAKILKKTTIYNDKAHYNLIIVSFFLGFFLRPYALQFGEFGTKTSFLLACFYPYLSYSFVFKNSLTKKDLIWRGVLLGLMPCLKPHYLILIIFIESVRIFSKEFAAPDDSFLKKLFTLDKLIMLMIGLFYIDLLFKYVPEYFELMAPMWNKIYSVYDDGLLFLKNTFAHLAFRVAVFSFIFLIFLHLKFTKNDKILIAAFLGASTLIILESTSTIDQAVVFYAIITIVFFKLFYDLLISRKFLFSENKFVTVSLLFLPFFDIDVMSSAVFGVGGLVSCWWIGLFILPFFYAKKFKDKNKQEWLKLASDKRKILLAILYVFVFVVVTVFCARFFGGLGFVASNALFLLVFLFFFEKLYGKFYQKFSPLSFFVIFAAVVYLFHIYFLSISEAFNRNGPLTSPNKLNDQIIQYSKIYAPKKEDDVIIFFRQQILLIMNYLNKDNYAKINFGVANSHRKYFANSAISNRFIMFPSLQDSERTFAYSYVFEDVKHQIKNKNAKVLFLNIGPDSYETEDRCTIGYLEYYFFDPEFKRVFLQNFAFKGRIIVTKKIKYPLNKKFSTEDKELKIFDKITPSKEVVSEDFEVYVRR